MLLNPSLHLIHQFLRNLGIRALTNQMRQDDSPDFLLKMRANMHERLGEKIYDSFERDAYTFTPQEISSDHYTWCAYLIPETQAFRRNLLRWSLCVAGYLRGEVHKAIVLEPHSGNYFWAYKNHGAYEKVRRLRFSAARDLNEAFIALHGRPQDLIHHIDRMSPEGEQGKQFLPSVSQLISRTDGFINSGSWLLDLLDCAAGRLDIFYGVPSSTALARVAELFVVEIGGIFATGKAINHSQPEALLVANAYLFHEAQRLLQDVEKQEQTSPSN